MSRIFIELAKEEAQKYSDILFRNTGEEGTGTVFLG